MDIAAGPVPGGVNEPGGPGTIYEDGFLGMKW